MPAPDGRKLPVQVAVPVVVPATRLQGLDVPKLPVAEPVDMNATVPRGVVGPALVSVTVTVQVAAWFTTTEASQTAAVVVEWRAGALTVMLKAVAVALLL